MKFTILGFSQKKLIEFGLDPVDALILRYFVDFKGTNSMVMQIHDNKDYYWLDYKKLMSQIPIIKIKNKDALRRRLKKLEQCKVLEHYHKNIGGSYSFYTTGEKYDELVYKDDDLNDPTQKSEGYDSKVGEATTQKSEQNINLLKDKSIKYNIEQIWSLYPNKKGKAKAINKIPKLINQYGYEQIERCVKRYAKEKQEENKKYIQHGSTFFNGGYMDYLDSNYKETKENTKSKSWGGKNFNE